jgi:hypothetical protein
LNLNSLTIHKLAVCALLTVHKYYSDAFYLNSVISEACGIPLKELNYLELEFINLLDFNLTVTRQEFQTHLEETNSFFDSHWMQQTKSTSCKDHLESKGVNLEGVNGLLEKLSKHR